MTLLLVLACASTPKTTPPRTDTEALDTAVDTADSGGPRDTADTAEPTDTSGSDDSGPQDTSGEPDTATTPDPTCDRYASPSVTGRVADASLEELSGLAVSLRNPGVLWALEDSGNAPVLLALDEQGDTVATVAVDAPNVDWEDLALGPCDAEGTTTCLWIGDIGDLGAARSSFVIYKVAEPDLATWDGAPLVPEALPFSYPDRAQDAEGLAVLPDGTPLVVTKRSDATAGLYTLEPGDDTLTWQADMATGAPSEDLSARATAAALTPDGTLLLVRTYLHLHLVDVTALATPRSLGELAFGLELQGEAVAWDPRVGGYRQVSEARGAPLYHAACR